MVEEHRSEALFPIDNRPWELIFWANFKQKHDAAEKAFVVAPVADVGD